MDTQTAPALADTLGLNPDQSRLHAITGGSIARAYRLEDERRRVFIKVLDRDRRAILDAERHGLARLAEATAIATPRIIGQGEIDRVCWLAFEWLEMRVPDTDCFARLGVQLHQLHRHRGSGFGLERNNFIGLTPQVNDESEDWSDFFINRRLRPQIERLAERHRNFDESLIEALAESWRHAFDGYQPEPCLLHGDLWSGNVAMLADGRPVVFDPAVHFGDRECDLAMADLFGGFDVAFFDAYRGHWPLESGWRERRRFYQLYHLLNHANLFAGHYLDICRKLIGDLVDHARVA
ncbi:MAG: fructosamine kinase family protein [Wenzhouxiangellaceae bacterium]|nr:fructosamine kinase family protein [Wenzhouxiangellaceae bacterium]